MADPLSLLRQYTIEGKQIEEREGHIIFGEFSWPKTVHTNFRIYGSENKEDGTWEYYTLGCLLYFLKNVQLLHPAYVRQAAGEDVPVVRRPDRRDLLAYLRGTDQQIPKSIDKSARLEMPTHVKRTAEDKLDGGQASKKARLDANASSQQLKERLAAKLDAPQDGKLSINRANLKNLSEDLTRDKIAEIRAKVISIRRTRIKPEDDEAKMVQSLGDLEVNREASTIFSRERQWRTRTSILQSSGKTFSKTVTAILGSVKAREEGKVAKPPSHTPRPPGMPGMPGMPMQQSQPKQLPNYNRYDQEQFGGKDVTHGFNIETTGTFSGMTLKSVTEGNANARNKQQNANRPVPPGRGLSDGSTNGAVKPGGGPGGHGALTSSNNANTGSGKRPSRTPIIIISAAPKSLITMYNARDVLQECKFVSTEDKKTAAGGTLKRDNELLIQRRKEGGLTVPYRVIDNPSKLTPQDWERVVAVFVMGQAWQFKGWPWEGNPTVIFSKICAFHIKWDESNLEKNIANWAVNIIQLSRNKRHLDRARLMVFWEVLDKYMVNNKPHLRF